VFAVDLTGLVFDEIQKPHFVLIQSQLGKVLREDGPRENKVICQFLAVSIENVSLHSILPKFECFESKELPKKWNLV